MKRDALVRAAEHLKEATIRTFAEFRDGIIPSAAEASARLSYETQATLQDLRPAAFHDVLYLRVTVPHEDKAHQTRLVIEALHTAGAEPLSWRYLGPRAVDEQGVLYVTARCGPRDVASVLELIDSEVRDWSYGCVRRGAA